MTRKVSKSPEKRPGKNAENPLGIFHFASSVDIKLAGQKSTKENKQQCFTRASQKWGF